ncbi:MAG: hypothetical protein Q4G22_09450 [Paracoccus sp. (in: a-proteobacteria)]|uniref:hypothetical protein n=1 Tax=Paracoccus sp. TaxID=267 RepID=UPI0026E038AD|nr:hypothetical protein [Paracoccus sp. (in: a-proteobacteria)]MDO5632052.1 hypothetical protein [Paracoccus sp. (in: a-proteobacteria)]
MPLTGTNADFRRQRITAPFKKSLPVQGGKTPDTVVNLVIDPRADADKGHGLHPAIKAHIAQAGETDSCIA